MNNIYNRFLLTANRMIRDKGVPCRIVSLPSDGGFDAITGESLPPTAATEQDGFCIMFNYKQSLVNMSDSLIEQGDKKILVDATGINLGGLNGYIDVMGERYTIVSIRETKPAEMVVLYEIHGRI